MTNPIFLITTGRTGTKFFSKFFSEYFDNVSSYHTTRNTEILNIICNLRSFNLLPEYFAKYIWKLKHRNILSHNNRYIECNPYYWNLLDIIAEDFPQAKFIIIIRSPREYIKSFIKKEKQNIRSKIANGIIPFWQPVSYIDQLKIYTNNYYQRVNFYAKTWKIKNEIFYEFYINQNNSRLIKFEDIFNEPHDIRLIFNILDWLELKPNKKINAHTFKIKINESEPEKYDDKWDKNCEKIVRSICGDLIEKINYNK